jgi:large subunit ribosomal protein L10
MPLRLQRPSKVITSILRIKRTTSCRPRQYASIAVAKVFSPSAGHTVIATTPPTMPKYPKTQPPSFKPAEFCKTQLLRQYASLLRSSPLTLLFQHNNLTSSEWMGIRRELTKALRKVDEAAATVSGKPLEDLAAGIKLQVIQTGIFAAALRVVEFYQPPADGDALTHVLSQAAHDAVVGRKREHALTPLLAGPLVLVTFPTVSPAHLKAALSTMAPIPPLFPAPTRRANPGWHDNAVQSGLQKLLLLGARIEGKVFDVEGFKWVGTIEGGLEGLRCQLVMLLQSMGAGVTRTLESAARNLYFTVEGRRSILEDEAKGLETSSDESKAVRCNKRRII